MSGTIIEVAVDAAVKTAVARVVSARLHNADAQKIIDAAVKAEAERFVASDEFRDAVRAALLSAVAAMVPGGAR